MEFLGYIAALIIGITLGMIGGGGSILTVPVLVYLLGVSPVLATAYSLFVVGVSSLIGAYRYATLKLVDYRTALVFGLPSMLAVFLTRKFLIPAIPEQLFSVGSFVMTKDIGIMVLFAIIMLAASFSMIKGRKQESIDREAEVSYNYPVILVEGSVVGVVTGMVGAGGGFLIIPALVLLAKLPMKLAVGTSLLIIALKSLIGFLGDIGTQQLDWPFLLSFTLFSVIGIFVGIRLSSRIADSKLKKGFGWFVLLMAIVILLKELVY